MTDDEDRAGPERNAMINTPLEVAMDVSRLVSEAKLAISYLDVSLCAERIARRHPLAACSKAQIEADLERAGVAAGISMKLAARKPCR